MNQRPKILLFRLVLGRPVSSPLGVLISLAVSNGVDTNGLIALFLVY